MQLLYLTLSSVALVTLITYSATERTQLNAIESLFTLNVSSGNSYPFCAWPANITVTECDSSISLLCVIHGCFHGPKIVVGDLTFAPGNDELTSTCVQGPDSGLNGTWMLHLTLEIIDVLQSWNSSDPTPVYCATATSHSQVAHLSILPDCCNDCVTETDLTSIAPSIPTCVTTPPNSHACDIEPFSTIFTLILTFLPLWLTFLFAF